jgi:hypothetical protein
MVYFIYSQIFVTLIFYTNFNHLYYSKNYGRDLVAQFIARSCVLVLQFLEEI